MSRKAIDQEIETDFFEDAACHGADTAVFFPVSDTYAGEAKSICAGCPVAEQCLEYAIATHQSDGVWGGLTASSGTVSYGGASVSPARNAPPRESAA